MVWVIVWVLFLSYAGDAFVVRTAPSGFGAADRAMTALRAGNQLEQLAKMTTLSIDSGDLKTIEKFSSTGLITDATTNPLFVAQAGLSGDPDYLALVDESVEYAKKKDDLGQE